MIRGALAAVLIATAAGSSLAYSPEGYPGWTWGNGTRDLNGFEGYGTQGNINQGIRWFTLPYDVSFKNYASYRWRMRTQNRQFYDARGPALGGEFTWAFFDFGADYVWQEYPQLHTHDEDPEIYLDWYKRVYYLGGSHPEFFGIPVVGYPTTFWGRMAHDFNNLEGNSAQGWVQQAVDWVRFPHDIVFRTLLSYNWRFRSKNQDFYNYQGPGIGAEFEHRPLNVGIEYIWRRYPLLHQNSHTFQLYLSWYYGWDLKDLHAGPTR